MEKQSSNLGWVFAQAGAKKVNFVFSVITAIIGVICQSIPFLIAGEILKMLVDGNKSQDKYLELFAYMLLCFLGKAIFHSISTSLSHGATFAILGNIRKRGLDNLANMPLGEVLAHPAGDLKHILVERVDTLETSLAHIVPEFTSNFIAFIFLFVILCRTDWRIALVSLITLPVGMISYMGMMKDYEKNLGRVVKAGKTLSDTAVEYIAGIQVIKAFSRVDSSYDRFAAAAKENANSAIDWMRASVKYFTFAVSIMPYTLITVLTIGAIFLKNGSIEPSTLVYSIALSVGLITPLVTMASYGDDIGAAGVVAKEIRAIVEAPRMKRPLELEKALINNDIELKDVKFSYQEKEVLHGIDMKISEGDYIALVGPSGSGKSTIARLIASLWDVDSGEISIGGVDIRDIPIDTYSDYIAYVNQDNYLFNQTIMDNIRIGKTKGAPATDEEVIEVAKKSGCYDFIMSLENGFDTIVGSSGGHLSGGERQRISIARAMLKDAPIVILDEATAYTDPENEAIIQRSVAKLIEGKTLIVIAHRLSTIKDADRIYVIEDGNIKEEGTHSVLIDKEGLYASMWKAHMSVRDYVEGGALHA